MIPDLSASDAVVKLKKSGRERQAGLMKSLNFIRENVIGDTAAVFVERYNNAGTRRYPGTLTLKKIDGVWKIDSIPR